MHQTGLSEFVLSSLMLWHDSCCFPTAQRQASGSGGHRRKRAAFLCSIPNSEVIA